uniref:Basic helix-loop-helix transcription factor n=1 Tax=Salvia miltiorrhiza TaxID=226208 RepID=A0A0H3Y8S3_SALMI|nr:basic helix-loop-helix transcription factor [Salvia miltiorrhiza]
MEILEDDFFYLNPFLAEIYSNCSNSGSSQTSDHGGAADQLRMSSTSWINSLNGREMAMPSSSIMAAAVEAPRLISFENERFSSFSPTNADHRSTDCNNLTPQIISFSSSTKDDDDDGDFGGKRERASTATRTPLQAQDHLMAERKRREDLRHLFIALSKVVPGLKKLDKASLLEDAINHLKSLEERVNVLEKEAMMSPREDISNSGCESVPVEISARVREKHVLIKMCCKKQMGLMSRIPCEMEKLHLNVVDIRIMPFGQAALDVTILAENKPSL